MEMEFKDNNSRRRKVFLVIGVVLAVASGGAAFYLSSQGTTAEAAPVPKRTIIVAVRDIPARTIIDAGMLTQREVTDDPSVAQAVTDEDLLLGRLTGVTIYANQAMTPNLLATSAAGAEFSILSPTETISPDSPTWRAISILVPAERAVGGHLEIGQRVDLFLSVSVITSVVDETGQLGEAPDLANGYQTGESTKITWEDIEVLAIVPDEGLYILKVDLHQAEEINHALASANLGKQFEFSFALRPDGDNRLVDRSGYGETFDRIFQQYNLPMPGIIDQDAYPQPSPEPSFIVPGGGPPAQPATPAPSTEPSPVDPSPEISPEPSASPTR